MNLNVLYYTSPLEQFIEFNIFGHRVSIIVITNLILSLLFVMLLIGLFLYNRKHKIYESMDKNILVDKIFSFLKNIFEENVNIKKPYIFSYIFFVFFVIFTSNVLGLIPFSFTVTSSIIFTFFFSLSSFINMLITGFKVHGTKFFNVFLPEGTPIFIVPFLILIEFISFNARVFSLAIRLFANMMSGHILLKILAAAACSALTVFLPWSLGLAIFPIMALLVITGLEVCIAFLQAYVFVTLLCIYFNESFNLH